MMKNYSIVAIPVLTLVIGHLLGYFVAIRQVRRRIAAEKRAEYASQFVALGYECLGALLDPALQSTLGQRKQRLALLGQQTAFFTTDRTAKAIDEMTTQFAGAVINQAHSEEPEAPGTSAPSDNWQTYRTALEGVRSLLRDEVQAKK
jgi:hypothetical protein